MRRLAVSIALLLVCWMSGLSGQSAPLKVPSNKKIWFTSAPGAVDLGGFVVNYDDPRYGWSRVRPHIAVVQHYQGQTMLSPPRNVEGNTYNILSREGFFRTLRTHIEIDQAIEVGAVKEFTCRGLIENAVNGAVDSVTQIYRAGGNVRYLTIDSSLIGGYNCPFESLLANQVAEMVAYFIKEVRIRVRDRIPGAIPLEIGDVEPYPGFPINYHKVYIDKIQSETKRYGVFGLSHYHIDVDIRIVKDDAVFSRDVRSLTTFLKERGIKSGIIVNGDDTDSVTEYFRTTNSRLVRYKNQQLFDEVDNIIFQSWANSSGGRQYLPPNAPENESYTHMNFMWHALNCIFNPSWDCERYPQP